MSIAVERSYGTGRRKTASARVFLKPGKGAFTINGRTLESYFGRTTPRELVCQPLKLLDVMDRFDFYITVRGSGYSAQAGAIRHGIARALLQYDLQNSASDQNSDDGDTGGEGGQGGQSWRKLLHKHDMLTRDSRMVERKKVGRHKARKSIQYSKR